MSRHHRPRGGPRRCSGDTRAAYSHSAHAVEVLEETEAVLKTALADTTAAPTPPHPRR